MNGSGKHNVMRDSHPTEQAVLYIMQYYRPGVLFLWDV